MAKLRIISNNLVDSATITASSTLGIHSVNNLKKVLKSKVWRSTSATTATLTFNFSNKYPIDSIVLPYTNFTPDSTVNIKLYSDATLVHDSGTVNTAKWSLIGTEAFIGIPKGVGTYAYGGGSCSSYWIPNPVADVNKVEITINNTGNSDSYIEVSSAIIGKAWAPKYNTSYGASVEFKDLSTTTRTEAGDLVPTKSTRSKAIEFDLSFMDSNDKLELTNILRRSGSSAPVFISVYPLETDVNLEGLYQIYGYLSPSSLTNVNFGLFSSQITVDEV